MQPHCLARDLWSVHRRASRQNCKSSGSVRATQKSLFALFEMAQNCSTASNACGQTFELASYGNKANSMENNFYFPYAYIFLFPYYYIIIFFTLKE